MAEKWGISRVGKLEVEVGETLQEAIIRLQILPLPPLAWTDCFLQTVRGHQVTITGTETHPDKIEAVASPAEVEDVVEKIDSAIENANKYVTRVVHSRQQAGGPDVKNAEADERQKLQAELDQLAEKLSKPEYAEDAGPD
jgi:sugar phosphate isomerase/epimerase